MNVDDFDYRLPPQRIAQRPAARRDASRLMVLDRESGVLVHSRFDRLVDWLDPGDLLVLNDTRVMPARVFGNKSSGGRVELLLTECVAVGSPWSEEWHCLIRGSVRPGTTLTLAQGLAATVLDKRAVGCRVRLESAAEPVERLIESQGLMPLPPYIKRPDPASGEGQALSAEDRVRYQTVFAKRRGAIAAPTAGLHFTERSFAALEQAGIERTFLTLHVGLGTFAPVRSRQVEDHPIHEEWFEVGQGAIDAIDRARKCGRRIVAVGTTVVRALEYVASAGRPRAASGECGLFIYPGYCFRVVDAIVTNFHLPRSTLLMLVSAFAGRQRVLDAYDVAVEQAYRFYSYGDAMLLRSAR